MPISAVGRNEAPETQIPPAKPPRRAIRGRATPASAPDARPLYVALPRPPSPRFPPATPPPHSDCVPPPLDPATPPPPRTSPSRRIAGSGAACGRSADPPSPAPRGARENAGPAHCRHVEQSGTRHLRRIQHRIGLLRRQHVCPGGDRRVQRRQAAHSCRQWSTTAVRSPAPVGRWPPLAGRRSGRTCRRCIGTCRRRRATRRRDRGRSQSSPPGKGRAALRMAGASD